MKLKRFEDLLGKVLSSVENMENRELVFTLEDSGDKYKLWHDQHCCESVRVEDICGDLSDLVGTPILLAEEVSSSHDEESALDPDHDSWTWTFYKLATNRGYATIRWYGVSNGYYSERVDWGAA